MQPDDLLTIVTFDSVLYGFDSNILARDITVKHNEANICIEISNVDNISGIEEKQNTFVPAGNVERNYWIEYFMVFKKRVNDKKKGRRPLWQSDLLTS